MNYWTKLIVTHWTPLTYNLFWTIGHDLNFIMNLWLVLTFMYCTYCDRKSPLFGAFLIILTLLVEWLIILTLLVEWLIILTLLVEWLKVSLVRSNTINSPLFGEVGIILCAHIVNYIDHLCLTTRHITFRQWVVNTQVTSLLWRDLELSGFTMPLLGELFQMVFLLYKTFVLTNYFHSWPVFSHAFQAIVSKLVIKVLHNEVFTCHYYSLCTKIPSFGN
jgi:signal transduction histidine kinase